MLENHQFDLNVDELPYKSGDILKAGFDVGSSQPNGNVIVKNGGKATFKATNQIFLEPGFVSEQGSDFEAIIEPCDYNSIRKQEKIIEVIDSKTIKIGDITIYDDSYETLSCDNDTLKIYGLDGDTTSFTNYWWDYGNGQTSDNSVAIIVYNKPGTYLVKLAITDSAGVTERLSKTYIKPNCSLKTSLITEAYNPNQKTSIPNPKFTPQKIKIYPNPSRGIFVVELGEGAYNQIQIIDFLGRQVYSRQVLGNRMEIDISNFSKGLYSVLITNEQGGVYSQKVVKN